MTGYFDKPHHWRMRADMTRTIAAGMVDREARKILLDVAADYDRMAQRLQAEADKSRKPVMTPAAKSVYGEVGGVPDLTDRLLQLQRKYRG